MGTFADYVALAKPRITVMVLGTAGLGLYMAPLPATSTGLGSGAMLGVLLGPVLIVASANASGVIHAESLSTILSSGERAHKASCSKRPICPAVVDEPTAVAITSKLPSRLTVPA